MTRPALSDEEFRLFGEWLSEEYGLRYGPEKRDILRSRLEPRRAELGFDSFDQLYFHLKFHPQRDAERLRLLPHLTNNESYFFREPGPLDALREEVLPRLREKLREQGEREVRLLSAGCSAGQEPYTLAILVRESGLFPAPWKVRITGIDVDADVIGAARTGRFRQSSFRRMDDATRDRYFRRIGEEWEILPQVRSTVEFHHANLVDPGWPDCFPPQHAIFCRNVLIYFDDDGIRRAAHGLYRALAPGGVLFLGHAETLSRVPHRFESVRRPGAIFYRRPEE